MDRPMTAFNISIKTECTQKKKKGSVFGKIQRKFFIKN